MVYNHQAIEKKWQKYWQEHQTFKTKDRPGNKKFYALDMFPYPSGDGLHVGHPKSYTATDIVSRFKRAQGYDVLHPMGWDAFGLPAEQYALDTGNDPAEFTDKNIQTFKRQVQSLGFSYDWDREINTTDPDYYRWTQWIFTKLYEKGLAYEAEIAVNWCPALGTVLANEEVINGVSERGGHPVYRRPMKQWMLRITAYADRLLDDLETLDWPESLKEMQRNWIGRSAGAQIHFAVQGLEGKNIEVFTTRPDTLFGVSYIVLAPEHELVDKVTTDEQKAMVDAYRQKVEKMTDLERTDLNEDKTGVFTGGYVIHPITGEALPIWIGDYVLASYGTGAVMAVPAHDERDYDFATKYELPILQVIDTTEPLPYVGEGNMIHSDFLDGLENVKAMELVTNWLEEHGKGEATVNYRLRDWLFSRQRYWGEPIPVIHWEDGTTTTVPEDQLPVILPKATDIHPSGTGESPLANIEEWLHVTDPHTGMKGRRETNTMPQWAGSSWYYIRYIDPHNEEALVDFAKAEKWLPVDLYIGGAEHAVLHLLYARFWHKFLYDLGVVPTSEPFQKLFNQGMILGEGNVKMSKSLGNVINPDDVVAEYGADTLRVYEMFMGPLDASIAWSSDGLPGTRRFLDRVWRLFINTQTDELNETIQDKSNDALRRVYNQTVKKVTHEIEHLHFNTAISQLMIFINEARNQEILPLEYAKGFVQLLAPFAPHLSEELWSRLGEELSISEVPWPNYDESQLQEDEVEIAVQINGKIRTRLMMDASLSKEAMEETVLNNEQVQENIAGKTIRKVIVVPNRLVNIVAN